MPKLDCFIDKLLKIIKRGKETNNEHYGFDGIYEFYPFAF